MLVGGRKRWLAGAGFGVALGTLVLGVGGRFAMRAIALLEGQTVGFSIGGTTTVVLLGALSGLVGALVLVGLQLILRKRRFLRGALFWAFLILITLRGLRPLDVHRVGLFLPLVILYGSSLQFAWCRFRSKRGSAHATIQAEAAT